mmetsp:Transcript_14094/g.29168  ORF Transcript_14094/g.29168 Transcript_14094/m.29168 type:complete len:129 (-) Transcript_14094:267-653(-)
MRRRLSLLREEMDSVEWIRSNSTARLAWLRGEACVWNGERERQYRLDIPLDSMTLAQGFPCYILIHCKIRKPLQCKTFQKKCANRKSENLRKFTYEGRTKLPKFTYKGRTARVFLRMKRGAPYVKKGM